MGCVMVVSCMWAAYGLWDGRELHVGCMGSCVVAVRGLRATWVDMWWP